MIRAFRPADLPRVMEIWLTANLQAHPFVDEGYWRDNEDIVRSMLPRAEVYVWEEQGELRGFVGLMEEYIAGIFVDGPCRGQGGGKALLDHAKGRHDRLTLQVYEKNRGAVRFYLREGFRCLRESVEEDSGETEYLMGWEKTV